MWFLILCFIKKKFNFGSMTTNSDKKLMSLLAHHVPETVLGRVTVEYYSDYRCGWVWHRINIFRNEKEI